MKANNFWSYCVQKEQLIDWAIVFCLCISAYFLIHFCYPLPATYSDSFSYIRAAIDDQFSIFRPFGYSAFLQIGHFFSQSIHAVFIIQTLIYAVAVGMFIMALKRYFPVKSWLQYVLEVVIVCSPVAFYMLNALMSDALFCASIFLMLAMLMVVIMEESWVAGVLFLFVFWVSLYARYSAMFFPIVFIPILFFIKTKGLKWGMIVGICVVFGLFYNTVSTNMQTYTRHRQFSTGFDGWQLANNAMCMLPYIDTDAEAPKNRKVRELHEFSKHRFDEQIKSVTHEGTKVTAGFLWSTELPLKQYLFYSMQKTGKPYPVLWARLGATTYADYGKWLIMTYPVDFWKYYLSLNIPQAFYPTSLEMVGSYSHVEVGNRELQEWFNYGGELTERYPIYSKSLKAVLPFIEVLTWGLLLIGLIILIVFWPKWTITKQHRIVFWLLFAFGFLYYGTTLFATPIVIRYWMPMHALKIGFVWCIMPLIQQIISYAKTH